MTDDLFRQDAYLRECSAHITAVTDAGIVLDRTVFYPLGGGQAGDSGVLVLAKSESLIYLMLGPVAVFATCLGLVQALKYALFEEQLRTRRLITLKRFLSDADMWKKVLS